MKPKYPHVRNKSSLDREMNSEAFLYDKAIWKKSFVMTLIYFILFLMSVI